MRLGLRNRILLPTLALIILGMGISTVVSYLLAGRTLKENTEAQLRQLTELTDQRISGYLKDRRADIKIWSQQKVFQAAVQDSFIGKSSRGPASELLAGLCKDSGYFELISITDASGGVVASSNQSAIGKINISDRDYFKRSFKGEIFVSNALISKTTGQPVFVISAPILDKEQVSGVIYGTLNLTIFASTFIDPIRIGAGGYAYVGQADGLMIAHPERSNVMKMNVNDFDFGRQMMGREHGLIEYTYGGKSKFAAFRKNKELGWIVCVTAMRDELLAPVKRLGYINSAVTAGAILASSVIVLLIAGSIARPINTIAEALSRGANQVASTSTQMASTSHELSEGSSQQAAAIEETSSSLEEMASMTKQNAENASQANSLMAEARQIAEDANQSMSDLTTSMSGITKASEDTQKIVKTIDEIAFQTNLLALNAAVEAARAGEAGAGFAVVADEVRNLAMRAAEAAKSTAGLIDETVKKVRDGSALVENSNQQFQRVAHTVGRSGELVAEITAASQEQAQGIDQVNRAVSEMDKVVQRNAANAEESASSSEELNAQAHQMKEHVHGLIALIGGNGNQKAPDSSPGPGAGKWSEKASLTLQPRIALTHFFKGGGNGNGTEAAISRAGLPGKKLEKTVRVEDTMDEF